MPQEKPHKAIIAAAGLGTRFLPWTKAMPKEMLPLGKKPVIHHIVEGLVSAGVTQIAIVGGPQKRAIEDHFDPSVELEQALENKMKTEAAQLVRSIPELANFVYIGQKGEPPGNARPLLNALDAGFIADNEPNPFYFMFADDFFATDVPQAQQLLDVYEATGKSAISLIEVGAQGSDKYGMADIGDEITRNTFQINGLVEKPGAAKRPSDYAAVSGYLLRSDIIAYTKSLKPSARGEIELPEAIGRLAAEKGSVAGRLIDGTYHDAGNPTSYAIAVIDYALRDSESAQSVREYLAKRLKM